MKMEIYVPTWSRALADREYVTRILEEAEGRTLTGVGYWNLSSGRETRRCEGFDEVFMGVTLRFEGHSLTCLWTTGPLALIGMGLIVDADDAYLAGWRSDMWGIDMANDPMWLPFVGQRLDKLVDYWEDTSAEEAGWSALFGVEVLTTHGRFVICLGKDRWDRKDIEYQPDAVVAIFDPIKFHQYLAALGRGPGRTWRGPDDRNLV